MLYHLVMMTNRFFKYYWNPLTVIILAFLICLKSWASGLQNELKTSLKLQGETLNFEIAGQKSWDYDIRRLKVGKQTKVQLLIKGLTDESIQSLQVQKNPFVESVLVVPKSIDDLSVVEFVLKNDQVDAFDYLTDQPSKLIIDFYFNDELPQQTASLLVKKDKKKLISKTTLPEKNKKSRQPADVDYLTIKDIDGIETAVDSNVNIHAGLFDGSDSKYSRFMLKDYEIDQASILKGLLNYYLEFPIIDQEYSFWKKMKQSPPEYDIKPNKTDENKQARLLNTLFKKNRYLVLKKTFDWFETKFPASKYLELGYLMTADSFIELWKSENKNEYFDQAIFMYDQFLRKYPDSALAERTSLYIGMLNIDKKNYLEATRKLNSHIENTKYKNKISNQYAQLGMAYALSKLGQDDKALKLVSELEVTSKDPLVRAEAAFRKADIYMNGGNFKTGLEQYSAAIQKHSDLVALFPNAYFNKMEALFRMKMPEKAHKAGLDFVQRFPTHEYAPYALTRVGELLEIMSPDQTKAMGAFLETHFRYGENPKTIIARLHLFSARMKSMKDQELKETIDNMNELSLKSDLENVDQFKATMISDGFARRNDYDRAIDILTKFYQASPNRKDSDQVTKRIVKNIHDQIKFFSNNNQHKNVLETVRKYSDTWLKKDQRIDTGYLVGRAYQSAGACRTAIKKYDEGISAISALKNDPLSESIRANQVLPTIEELYLNKAHCLYEDKKYQQAYEEVQKISEPDRLSEEQQIQRVYLVSEIFQKKGDVDSSIRYLNEVARVWQDKPEKVGATVLKLAELQYKKLNYTRAADLLKNLTKQKINDDLKVKSYQLLSKIGIESADSNTAISSLTDLLNQYEKSRPLSEERFKLGQVYFNLGEVKKAEDAWSQLQGKDSPFWEKLAAEKINNLKWKQDYKQYLKRIPATAQESVSKELAGDK
jgi:tetratricopeptide (TPR) repeat protein